MVLSHNFTKFHNQAYTTESNVNSKENITLLLGICFGTEAPTTGSTAEQQEINQDE